ncbi:MAG TPA: universal stress protein [Burkholderiaceae bacterium]|nr:universal stress protein [Burkholderiaceae bacterium]
MHILLAADGSRFTKKALGFLLANDNLRDPSASLVVLNVQPALPPHIANQLGKRIVVDYQREQAEKVLQPITRFLDKHGWAHHSEWTVGKADEEIIKAARKQKVHLIVMGTHGHGALGRILLGSVAQRVTADSPVPVLLVK